MYHSGQKNRLSAGLLLYSNSQPLLLILGKHKEGYRYEEDYRQRKSEGFAF